MPSYTACLELVKPNIFGDFPGDLAPRVVRHIDTTLRTAVRSRNIPFVRRERVIKVDVQRYPRLTVLKPSES